MTAQTRSPSASDIEQVEQDFSGLGDSARAVYLELRSIARRERQVIPSGTLNTTALVNEVWLRLEPDRHKFRDRRHFLGVASVAMRRLVVDYARYRKAQKRGGDAEIVRFDDNQDGGSTASIDRVIDIDRAMDELKAVDQRLYQLVELRFFAGLSNADAADVLGISTRTAARDWTRARALLKLAVSNKPGDK